MRKISQRRKSYEYLFSLGNSSNGPIGFCATVRAKNELDAVDKLKNAIEWFGEQIDAKKATGLGGETSDIEYLRIYFNAAGVTKRDILDISPVK